MELYGLVRRAVMLEGLSQRAAALRFGIDRGTVTKMIASPAPPGYRRKTPVRRPKLADHDGYGARIAVAPASGARYAAFMPYKFHEPHRHKIPRARYRVTNWPEYDRGLVQRGDIRVWISEDALAAWAAPRRRTRGGQPRYSDLAIETVLILATVFRLPLRQAEGFTRSLMELMSLDLAVPDHTTLARRRRKVPVSMNAPRRAGPVDLVLDSTGLKFYGPGEWYRLKYGEKRRAWRKLDLAVDASTGEILAHVLTDSDTSDAAMAGPLVASADGAPVYDAIRQGRPPRAPPKIVIPPGKSSIPKSATAHGGSERERHAAEIAARGRTAW